MTKKALEHIAQRPVMRRLIREVGPCTFARKRAVRRSIARAGCGAPALNGTAANTILSRFIKLFPSRRFPHPEDLANVTDPQIRACGFSFAKIAAIP